MLKQRIQGSLIITYMILCGIEVGYSFVEATNFDFRITKEEVERLLNEHKTLPFKIMCEEYGGGDDWSEVNKYDLDEFGHLDEKLETFEIWLEQY